MSNVKGHNRCQRAIRCQACRGVSGHCCTSAAFAEYMKFTFRTWHGELISALLFGAFRLQLTCDTHHHRPPVCCGQAASSSLILRRGERIHCHCQHSRAAAAAASADTPATGAPGVGGASGWSLGPLFGPAAGPGVPGARLAHLCVGGGTALGGRRAGFRYRAVRARARMPRHSRIGPRWSATQRRATGGRVAWDGLGIRGARAPQFVWKRGPLLPEEAAACYSRTATPPPAARFCAPFLGGPWRHRTRGRAGGRAGRPPAHLGRGGFWGRSLGVLLGPAVTGGCAAMRARGAPCGWLAGEGGAVGRPLGRVPVQCRLRGRSRRPAAHRCPRGRAGG